MTSPHGLEAAGAREAASAAPPNVLRPSDGGTEFMEDLRAMRFLFGNTHLSDVHLVFHAQHKDGATNSTQDETSVEQHLLPAHRLVLSLRSAAFRRALRRIKSSRMPGQVRFPIKVIIEDTTFSVFSTLLRFLYTNEVVMEQVDEGADKPDKERQFWKDLLRAAFVYTVPSLVEICTEQLKQLLRNSDGNESSAETNDASGFQHLRKVLDVLVFCDNVIATKTLCASLHISDHPSLAPTQEAGCNGSEQDDDAVCCERCLQSVKEVQEQCMSELEEAPEDTFEALVRSEFAKQCSTRRFCDILKRRSRAPLVSAIRYQLGNVVNELLSRGASLDVTDERDNLVPLMAALKAGNDKITRRVLVDSDAPYFLLTDKIPIFFLACASGNLMHCQILLDQNPADVNLISPLEDGDKDILAEFGRHQTPLHIASSKGHSAVVELLLSKRAASNLQDEEGNTPLHRVANIETARVLVSSTYRTNPNIPNRRGQTPLHVAASSGHVEVVDLLLQSGADPEVLDDQGQSAFHVAAAHGQSAVALILLRHQESKQRTPHQEVGAADRKSEGDVSSDTATSTDVPEPTFPEQPVFDINQEDVKGNTALHLAATSPQGRCHKTIQLLLENGADPNRVNWFHYTPLHLFCSHQNGPGAVIDMFVEHGADIHAQSLDGSTPAHLAVGRASEEVVVQLAIAGVQVHLQDAAGRSVVALAETTSQGTMVVPLLRNLSKPPEWIADDQVKDCSCCHSEFRLAMRKHHCRHCGRVLCYNCASNQLPIPKFDLAKAVRVCDACFDVLSFRRLM